MVYPYEVDGFPDKGTLFLPWFTTHDINAARCVTCGVGVYIQEEMQLLYSPTYYMLRAVDSALWFDLIVNLRDICFVAFLRILC